MTTKYWQLSIKGERSADEIQSAVGSSGGLLLRVHVERGQTRVYFAAQDAATKAVAQSIKGAKALTAIALEEVTKLG